MTLAMDELVKYFTDLGDINEMEHTKLTAAIKTQFKEIKNVITGCSMDNLANFDADSLRDQIIASSHEAMTRTESKKFGGSTSILALISDFEELREFWQEKMEEQKHAADQHEIAANQFKLEASIVQTSFEQIKTDLEEKFSHAAQLGDTVIKFQTEVD